MKATEITMQIVKNIGNYESVRLQATFQLDEKDNIDKSFQIAKDSLESAFRNAYAPELTAPIKVAAERKTLEKDTSEFIRVCKAIQNGQTNVEELQLHFILSKEVINYFKDKKLL